MAKFVMIDQLETFREDCKKLFALKGEGGGSVAGALKYKGSVENYSDLPTNAESGDVWNVQKADKTHSVKAGENVVWNGEAWDNLGGTVDLSDYALEADQKKDIVSASATDDTITLIARDSTKIPLTLKKVEEATKATQDSEGNVIATSYTKANTIVTDVSGENDTLVFTSVHNENGIYSGYSTAVTITNVAHATEADAATKATCDGDGNTISTTYAKVDDQLKDVVSANVSDATITLTARDGTNTTLTVSNVERAAVANKAITAEAATSAIEDGQNNNITATYAKKADLATVATTGSYNDLIDKPTFSDDYTLPIASTTTLGGVKLTEGHFEIGTDGALTVKYATKALWASDAYKAEADVAGNQIMFTYAKNSDLATVATSGSYADLSNKIGRAHV